MFIGHYGVSFAAKRWALAGLLAIAALVYYFADVFVEMLQIQGVSVFIR